MRILDQFSDCALNNAIVYLTISEAIEFRDSLSEIIENPKNNHTHILSEDYNKELTVCIYDIQNINEFDARSQRLIRDDF